MSFVVKGKLDTSKLRLSPQFAESLKGELRDTLDIVRKEGEAFLKSIVPVDQGFLIASAHGGTNQKVVYWRVLAAPAPNRDAEYGYFQNAGWTDRGGTHHQGHFFMERTEAFAQLMLYRMTGEVLQRNHFIGTMQFLGNRGITLDTLGDFRGKQLGPHIANLTPKGRRSFGITGVRASYNKAAEAEYIRRQDRSTNTRATRDIIGR